MHPKGVVLLVLVGACGGGGNQPPIDASPDDAPAFDATVADAETDAATDAAEPDAGPDAGIDASIDAGIDAGIDAATPDAGIDAGPPDAGPDADPGCVMPAFTLGVSTLAGCEDPGNTDGARTVARFFNPVNVAIGPGNLVYVADFDNHRIRVVDATGTVDTLVAQTGFQRPFGIAFAADGTLYVSTDDNATGAHSQTTGTIWEVNTTTGAATVVAANIGRPRGIAVLPEPDGRIVLSDYLHHTVRLLDPDTGTITDLAGALDTSGFADANGAAARFAGPYGVAVLPDGRIAVADLFNQRIRAVELDGDVTTLAGTGAAGFDNGAANGATFRYPQDVAVDTAGNLYIADLDNFVVRKLAAGQVTTAVGSGTSGASDNDNLLAAELHGLEGLDVSPDGATLWIADGSRGEDTPFHRVRIADLDGP